VRVAITTSLDEPQRRAFREVLGQEVVFISGRDPERRLEDLREAEVVVSFRPNREMSPDELREATRLRLVQLLSAGADHVDFAALPQGVLVAGNVGGYADPMAEHALAMALALAKRLARNDESMARGEFPHLEETIRLRGAVVGFGGIGRASAWLFRCMGMSIHAINTTGRTDGDVEFVGTLRDLEAVLRASDVVLLSIPLTHRTRGLIGERELGWMKPTTILINVARGAVVDEEALYRHLRASPAFSAGLDAWWDEPRGDQPFKPRFPFLELPNVLGSPHNSAIVPGFEVEAATAAARNVARFRAGERPAGIQDPKDYAAQ